MTSPPGSTSAVGGDTSTHTSPVLDRAAAVATPRVPFLDRAAAHAPSSGGTHVRAAAGSDRFAGSGTGHGSAQGSGSGSTHTPGSLTPQEFAVALHELHDALALVNGRRARVSDLLHRIRREFEAAHDAWQSPAAATFETTATWFATSSRALKDLLDEMAHRMQTTYDTYLAAETANTHNSGG